MAEGLPVLLLLIAMTVAATAVSERTVIPAPVILTLAGILASLVRGFPTVELEPRFVLLVLLPPLVYASAVEVPWDDFSRNLRPIGMLAGGLVVATTAAVAAVAHALVPGLSWPAAVALGAIVSPTDPVASSAVASRLGVPRRLITIIEGEGLVNDAVALTLLKLATVALATGAFSAAAGVTRFAATVTGEITYGLLIGWLMGRMRKPITDPKAEVALSLLTPFAAYLVPEALGGSGVLAVVAAGMYVGVRSSEMVRSTTRLRLTTVWAVIVYLLNGVLFLLTGLEFRPILIETDQAPDATALLYGGAVLATVVMVRFIWTLPGAWTTRLLFPRRRKRKTSVRALTFVAWSGMRGGISLAAALSLPHTVPGREVVLLITATVVAGTLLLQGSALPFLIRGLRLHKDERRERESHAQQEAEARLKAVEAALEELRRSPDPSAALVLAEYERRRDRLRDAAGSNNANDGAKRATSEKALRLRALATERRTVIEQAREHRIPEHILHRIERSLDLAEARLSDPSAG